MRRTGAVLALATALATTLVATPAYGFAHNAVPNAFLHTLLDVLTLAVASAPLWTAYLWGPRRRGLLLALVAVVQLPVAVIGFLPFADPALHLGAVLVALALTVASLTLVRRQARAVVVEVP